MRTITLESYGKSDVEAFTDCYAETYGRVILLSIIGNDSAVSAISESLLDNRRQSRGDVYVNDEKQWNGKRCLSCYSTAGFTVSTSKLGSGVTHQLILDDRFLRLNEKDTGSHDEGTRYVLGRPREVAADLVYQCILRHLPTPTLPEWSQAIYEQIRANSDDFSSPTTGRIEDIDTYPKEFKVMCVQITEEALDAVVSDLVKRRMVDWE